MRLTIKQAEPGKVRMVMAANTIDDVKLSEKAKRNLEDIKQKIRDEKQKRREVERELREVIAKNEGAYRPGDGDMLILGS